MRYVAAIAKVAAGYPMSITARPCKNRLSRRALVFPIYHLICIYLLTETVKQL